MPTLNYEDVTIKRATLLLAIQQKIPIDISDVLMEQIEKCVHSRTVKNWFFPKLITAFVVSQGVEVYYRDTNCEEVRPIDQQTFQQEREKDPIAEIHQGAQPSKKKSTTTRKEQQSENEENQLHNQINVGQSRSHNEVNQKNAKTGIKSGHSDMEAFKSKQDHGQGATVADQVAVGKAATNQITREDFAALESRIFKQEFNKQKQQK